VLEMVEKYIRRIYAFKEIKSKRKIAAQLV
jgi:hypothetical protein